MSNQPSPGEGRKSPLETILEHRAQVEEQTPGWVENKTGDRKRAENVKPLSQLEDETALELLGRACEVSALLTEFTEFVDIRVDQFRDLAAQEHGVKWRSNLGNRNVQSRDGLVQIVISMGCLYHIDSTVQDAYSIVMECVERWGDGAADAANIKSLAISAFSATETGALSRARLGMLLDFTPENPTPEWDRAMKIIRDAIQIASRKRSIRVQWRESQQSPWRTVPLSTIAAEAVPAKGSAT